MNSLNLNGKKYLVPSSWAELSSKQGQAILQILTRGSYSKEQCIKAILLVLLNVGKNWYLQYIFFFKLTKADLEKCFPFTDFIFQNLTPTINFFPVIKVKGKKLYGPANEMDNSSFVEFIRADYYYCTYLQTQEEEYLNKLIATLYRTKKSFINILLEKFEIFGYEFSSDKRRKYNDDNLAERAKLVSTLSDETKKSILYFFDCCRDYIIKHSNHTEIFVRNEEGSGGGGGDWFTVLDDLSGQHFGDFNATAHTSVYVILFHLNKIITRNKEAKENAERNGN